MTRGDIDKLPGIKQRELQPCALCDNGVGHGNYPLFWRLRMQRFAIDVASVQRQHGFELMLGSPALARAMGPDADLAKAVYGPHQVLVCESCVLSHLPGLFVIAEAVTKRADLRRENLENERNELLNGFGNGAFRDGQTPDRLQAVETELRGLGWAPTEAGAAAS
jgi:hypothetical protein